MAHPTNNLYPHTYSWTNKQVSGWGGGWIGTSKGGAAGRYIETQRDREMVRWIDGSMGEWVGWRSDGRTGR